MEVMERVDLDFTQAAKARLRAAVIAAADNETPDPETLARDLILSGTSGAEFAQRIELLEARRRAVQRLAETRSTDEAIRQAGDEAANAQAELDVLLADTNARIEALQTTIRTAHERLVALRREQAEQQRDVVQFLNRTADPSIDAQMRELNKVAGDLRNRLNDRGVQRWREKREKLQRIENAIKSRTGAGESVRNELNAVKDALQTPEMLEAEHTLADCQKRLAALDQEAAVLRDAKSDPERMRFF